MNIGQILRRARDEMGFSEKEVADNLHIPPEVIASLESDDWSGLPARVYSRGFLKKYADYLKLPADDVLKKFDEEWNQCLLSKAADNAFLHEREGSSSLSFDRRHIIISLFLIVIIVVGLFFLYEFRFAVGSPKLILNSPAGDSVASRSSFPVSGIVEKESILTLNGRLIYTNERGEFNDTALLAEGLNVLEFEATNRFGKTKKIVRYILVK